VALGLELRGIATAAIDVSDGLLADLGHILEQSGAGAEIHFEALPLHEVTRRHIQLDVAKNCVLAGGDDYELCFTAPAERHAELLALANKLALPLSCIGRIVGAKGLALLDGQGQPMLVEAKGFDHFAQ
jgi:thiamine-monophosphate kinase